MNEFWAYFIFVGLLVAGIFFLIYFRKKIFKKKKKGQEERVSNYKCLDGHFVKSRGEIIIDNYLYILGIKHEYEKKIKIFNQKVKSDWFLPDLDVYIEYWGFHGKNYLKRKKEKIKFYKKAKLKLISIENYMFSDIYFYLNKKLKPFINIEKIESLLFTKKYCSNCGIALDERF